MTGWRHISGSAFGLTAGFLIWASAYASVYAAVSLGCTMDWNSVSVGPTTIQHLIPALLLAGHISVLVVLLRFTFSRSRAQRNACFLLKVQGITTAFALAATIWTGTPLLGLSNCSAPLLL